MRIAVLGARAAGALDWARALTLTGHEVYAADTVANPPVRFSLACREYWKLPSPRLDLEHFGRVLLAHCKKAKVDGIIPVCEESFALASLSSILSEQCPVFSSDLPLLSEVHHKGRFADLSRKLPCSAPSTHTLKNQTDLNRFSHDCADWVFKPAYSRFATYTRIGPQSISGIKPSPSAPWVAQRLVRGQELCSFSIFRRGRLQAHVTYRHRARLGLGAGVWFEYVSQDQILEFATEFGIKTGYHGQAGFDFIQDQDGKIYVIECNPRATSGIHAFSQHPALLVEALFGAPKSVLIPRSTPRQHTLPSLLSWLGSNHSSLSLKHILSAKDVVFHSDDPMPFLAQPLLYFEFLAKMLSTGKNFQEVSTEDIEYNGE